MRRKSTGKKRKSTGKKRRSASRKKRMSSGGRRRLRIDNLRAGEILGQISDYMKSPDREDTVHMLRMVKKIASRRR
jgi:hypothetical protein